MSLRSAFTLGDWTLYPLKENLLRSALSASDNVADWFMYLFPGNNEQAAAGSNSARLFGRVKGVHQ